VIAQSSLNPGLVRGSGKKEFDKRAGSGNADGTNKIGSEDHISDSIAHDD
jgi:hypothetical protein